MTMMMTHSSAGENDCCGTARKRCVGRKRQRFLIVTAIGVSLMILIGVIIVAVLFTSSSKLRQRGDDTNSSTTSNVDNNNSNNNSVNVMNNDVVRRNIQHDATASITYFYYVPPNPSDQYPAISYQTNDDGNKYYRQVNDVWCKMVLVTTNHSNYFDVVEETLEGYTIMYNPTLQRYEYATTINEQEEDDGPLILSGIPVIKGLLPPSNITKHLRPTTGNSHSMTNEMTNTTTTTSVSPAWSRHSHSLYNNHHDWDEHEDDNDAYSTTRSTLAEGTPTSSSLSSASISSSNDNMNQNNNNVHIMIVPIQFANHGYKGGPVNEYAQVVHNHRRRWLPPINRIHHMMNQQLIPMFHTWSQGLLTQTNITYTILTLHGDAATNNTTRRNIDFWIPLKHNESYYSSWSSFHDIRNARTTGSSSMKQIMKETMEWYFNDDSSTTAASSTNDEDNDNDSRLVSFANHVVTNHSRNSNVLWLFLHSGYGSEFGGVSEDGAYFKDRIWSHTGTMVLSETNSNFADASNLRNVSTSTNNDDNNHSHTIFYSMVSSLYGTHPSDNNMMKPIDKTVRIGTLAYTLFHQYLLLTTKKQPSFLALSSAPMVDSSTDSSSTVARYNSDSSNPWGYVGDQRLCISPPDPIQRLQLGWMSNVQHVSRREIIQPQQQSTTTYTLQSWWSKNEQKDSPPNLMIVDISSDDNNDSDNDANQYLLLEYRVRDDTLPKHSMMNHIDSCLTSDELVIWYYNVTSLSLIQQLTPNNAPGFEVNDDLGTNVNGGDDNNGYYNTTDFVLFEDIGISFHNKNNVQEESTAATTNIPNTKKMITFELVLKSDHKDDDLVSSSSSQNNIMVPSKSPTLSPTLHPSTSSISVDTTTSSNNNSDGEETSSSIVVTSSEKEDAEEVKDCSSPNQALFDLRLLTSSSTSLDSNVEQSTFRIHSNTSTSSTTQSNYESSTFVSSWNMSWTLMDVKRGPTMYKEGSTSDDPPLADDHYQTCLDIDTCWSISFNAKFWTTNNNEPSSPNVTSSMIPLYEIWWNGSLIGQEEYYYYYKNGPHDNNFLTYETGISFGKECHRIGRGTRQVVSMDLNSEDIVHSHGIVFDMMVPSSYETSYHLLRFQALHLAPWMDDVTLKVYTKSGGWNYEDLYHYHDTNNNATTFVLPEDDKSASASSSGSDWKLITTQTKSSEYHGQWTYFTNFDSFPSLMKGTRQSFMIVLDAPVLISTNCSNAVGLETGGPPNNELLYKRYPPHVDIYSGRLLQVLDDPSSKDTANVRLDTMTRACVEAMMAFAPVDILPPVDLPVTNDEEDEEEIVEDNGNGIDDSDSSTSNIDECDETTEGTLIVSMPSNTKESTSWIVQEVSSSSFSSNLDDTTYYNEDEGDNIHPKYIVVASPDYYDDAVVDEEDQSNKQTSTSQQYCLLRHKCYHFKFVTNNNENGSSITNGMVSSSPPLASSPPPPHHVTFDGILVSEYKDEEDSSLLFIDEPSSLSSFRYDAGGDFGDGCTRLSREGRDVYMFGKRKQGNTLARGIMFDIRSTKLDHHINVYRAAAFHLSKGFMYDVDVYTKNGSHKGYEYDSTSWIKVFSSSSSDGIEGRGKGVFTWQSINLEPKVSILGHTTQAFYIVIVNQQRIDETDNDSNNGGGLYVRTMEEEQTNRDDDVLYETFEHFEIYRGTAFVSNSSSNSNNSDAAAFANDNTTPLPAYFEGAFMIGNVYVP